MKQWSSTRSIHGDLSTGGECGESLGLHEFCGVCGGNLARLAIENPQVYVWYMYRVPHRYTSGKGLHIAIENLKKAIESSWVFSVNMGIFHSDVNVYQGVEPIGLAKEREGFKGESCLALVK